MFPQVVVPEAETRAGLTLKPQTFPLVVKDGPVMDVAFVQFLASVSGKVSCLGKMFIDGKNRSFQRERWVGRGGIWRAAPPWAALGTVVAPGGGLGESVLHLVLVEKLLQ